MAKPQNKIELLEQANIFFDNLQNLIDSLCIEQQEMPFCFAITEKDKEAHWKRDKNIRDVLIHLYEWQQLLINFIVKNHNSDKKIPFLPKEYNWQNYSGMNIDFWEKHQDTSLERAKELLKESHRDVISIIESFSNEELFTKAYFSYSGTTSIAAYCISATTSHYDWAIKKIKRQIKELQKD